LPLHPPPAVHPDLPALGDELTRLGYTQEAVSGMLGVSERDGLLDYVFTASQPMIVLEPEPRPASLLAHLLLAGGWLLADDVEAILSPLGWGAAIACGLLVVDGDEVRASCLLLPIEGIWLACGRREERFEEDYVFYPDRSSIITAGYLAPLPGEPTRTALDVGTGSGIEAFLLARHHPYARIDAIDPNPRALAFAGFSAALNGLTDRIHFAPLPAGPWSPGLDLIVFVIPQIYSVPVGRAIASYAREGEALLVDTYRRIAASLSGEGRALLYHQALTAPGRDLASWLAREGLGELSVIWRPTPAPYPAGCEFGVALIRRRRAGDRRFTRVELGGRGLVLPRDRIAEHLAARAVAESDRFAQARPALLDGPARAFLRVDGQRLGDTGQLEIGGVLVPSALLPLLARCDGKRTVAEIGAELPDADLARQALRSLIEAGVLTLRAGPG
jgi:SAM-dependent methyltransferase